jgi:hypothetical protein
MDEALLKQLVRQMKILNLWISVFGTLILTALIICIYFVFKVVTFVQDTSNKLNSIQENTQNTLNVQKQLCGSDAIGGFLNNRSDYCK